MKSERLLTALGQIEECYILEADPTNVRKTRSPLLRRPAAIAAALALFLCVSGTAALGAGGMRGHFKDIMRWDGAVVGTAYEQASDEIRLTAAVEADSLLVELTMLYPDQFPYRLFETLGIRSFQILDVQGNVLIEATTEAMSPVADAKATVRIPLEKLPSGSYRLLVSQMTGESTTELPLVIYGSWTLDFTK